MFASKRDFHHHCGAFCYIRSTKLLMSNLSSKAISTSRIVTRPIFTGCNKRREKKKLNRMTINLTSRLLVMIFTCSLSQPSSTPWRLSQDQAISIEYNSLTKNGPHFLFAQSKLLASRSRLQLSSSYFSFMEMMALASILRSQSRFSSSCRD